MALNSSVMESILKAMDIIAGSKVNQMSYDSTVICTIIDDSDKKNGCYTVTDGTIDFKAYSEVTNYKSGEQVRVSVPNGDYTQNKYIEGKYVTDNNTSPITYVSPLDSVIDMGGLIDGTEDFVTGNLIANKIDPSQPKGIVLKTIKLDDNAKFKDLQENDIYDTIFLQADFRSLLNNKKMRSGTFGLRLDLEIRTNSKNNPYIKHSLYLDSSEMLGNPYSFTIFTTQAKKFDISKIGIIDRITLYFYQNNDFTYYNGQEVAILPIDKDNSGKEIENLFVKNIYLGFGSDISAITDNTIQLYSSDSMDFRHFEATDESNVKNIGFLWYNKNDLNQYIGFSDGVVNIDENEKIVDYDEIDYIEKSNINNRLIAQKGKEVPTDAIGLKLSADIEEAISLLKETSKLITSDLTNTLKSFKERINPIKEFDVQRDYIAPLSDIANEVDNVSEMALSYYTNGLKRAAAIQKKQSGEDIEISAAPEFFDVQGAIKNVFNELHNKFYEIDFPNSEQWFDWTVNFIPDYKEIINISYQGFQGIYDTYAIRVSKIFQRFNEILNQLNVLFTDQHKVIEYNEATPIIDYLQPDFSNYDNRYCVYWYRYVKGYFDENEPFMDKEWQRFTPEYQFNIDSKTLTTLSQNTGLPNEYTIDGEIYYLNKKPAANEGIVTIFLNPELKEEKFAVVVIYNHEVFKSGELVFTNIDTFDDPTTVDKSDALHIEHGEHSLETYQSLYSASNFLTNSKDASVIRKLRVRYDGLLHKDEALAGAQIYWYVPDHTTMIAAATKKLQEAGFKSDYPRTARIKANITALRKPASTAELSNKSYNQDDTVLVYQQIGNFYSTNKNNTTGFITSSWVSKDVLEFVDSEYHKDGYICFYKQIGSKEITESQWDEELQENITIKKITCNEEDTYFYYKIKDYYNPTFLRNTIFCRVEKNEYPFETDISLTFGVLGTSGTDYTLLVTPSSSQVAIQPSNPLQLTVGLYNYNNEPIKMYRANNPLSEVGFNTRVEWIGPQPNYVFDLIEDETDGSICAGQVFPISQEISPTMYGGIAKVTTSFMVSNNGDEMNTGKRAREVDLSTLYSIPWSSGDYYVEGATSIVYDSDGANPNYFKDPYRIFENHTNEEISRVTWRIVYFLQNTLVELNNLDPIYKSYVPVLNDKNGLTPCNMYIHNMECYPVIQCLNSSNTVIWSQPIIIIQNRYPSAMLNSWDGSLTIDEKNGTILSTMIGAGRKASDNTFEGVLMGDIAAGANFDLNNKSGLGLYGFNHGAQSFGLNIDGTAFFGKSGRGRIEIDGNSGTISSASYQKNKKDDGTSDSGMIIDLDDGFIDMIGTTGNNTDYNYSSDGTQSHIRLDVKSPYFQIVNQNGKSLLNIAKDSYYLQTSDYIENISGTKIDLQTGKIDSYNFELTTGSALHLSSNPGVNQDYFSIGNTTNYIKLKKVNTNGDTNLSINSTIFTLTAGTSPRNIIIDSQADTYPLSIGNKFKVSWDGILNATEAVLDSATISGTITTNNITATGGSIGNWEISGGNLQSSNGSVVLNGTSGAISGSSISGGSITGSSISGGSVSGSSISGGSITSAAISGGSLHIAGGIIEADADSVEINGATISGGSGNQTYQLTASGNFKASSAELGRTSIKESLVLDSGVSLNMSGNTINISGGTIQGAESSYISFSGNGIHLYGPIYIGLDTTLAQYIAANAPSGGSGTHHHLVTLYKSSTSDLVYAKSGDNRVPLYINTGDNIND